MSVWSEAVKMERTEKLMLSNIYRNKTFEIRKEAQNK